MTRALGVLTVGLGLAVMAAPTARAGGHYGSFGFQMGFYHYPPPGGGYAAPAGSHHHHRTYAAPATYGYAPTYAPMMMAPAAGCSGLGYAPMMAPAGGCSGSGYSPAYGYGYAAPSYGYGYAAPSYGYGYGAPQPQSGFLTLAGGAGGLLEALRALKEVRDTIDDFRGGSKADAATKDEIAKLRTTVEGMRRDLDLLKVPADLDLRLKEIRDGQEALKLDLAKLRRDFDTRPEKK